MSGGVEQLLEEGKRYCAQKQYAQAETVYRQVLAAEPENVNALQLLGDLAVTGRRLDIAVGLLAKAAELAPRNADVAVSLGNARLAMGAVEAAVAEFRRVVAIQPDSLAGHNNLAVALIRAGRLADALPAIRKVVELRPGFAEAHALLGNTLVGVGRHEEAIGEYQRAIALSPNTAGLYVHLSHALLTCGRPVEAAEACAKAVGLGAATAAVYNQWGIALQTAEQATGAVAAYHKALEREPGLAEVWANMGISLKALGQMDEAIAALAKAIGLRPTFVDAYNSLGNALRDTGQCGEAVAAYRRALEIQPEFLAARDNLIYTLHFDVASDGAAIAAEARKWNEIHAAPLAGTARKTWHNDRSADRRLRVGYVSADFRNHVMSMILFPLIQSHDRRQVEVICYSNVRSEDAVTGRFRAAADWWRPIKGLGDEDAAALIAADAIDILVDLSSHMCGNRLGVFARRPAPVQATFNGYPGSTGLSAMDYRLTDPHLDPPGLNDAHYTEKSIRLADSVWVYAPGNELPEVGHPPARRAGCVTFGCLNNFGKATGPTLSMWSEILSRTTDSRLILLCPRGGHREEVIRRLGIAAERVEFVDVQSRQKYLETYGRIDIALDTYPYNGHITSLDAMWMGVPVISLCGTTAVSRAGWSHANNLGLTELVANRAEDFVRLAVELAGDQRRMEELRTSLRGRLKKSPLMDAPRFSRNVEAAYREMWRERV